MIQYLNLARSVGKALQLYPICLIVKSAQTLKMKIVQIMRQKGQMDVRTLLFAIAQKAGVEHLPGGM